MGISDDIHRRAPKKQKSDHLPITDTNLKTEDLSEIIEPEASDQSQPEDNHQFFSEPKPAKTKESSRSGILLIILAILVIGLIGVAVYQNLDLIKEKIFKNTNNTTNSTTNDTNIGLNSVNDTSSESEQSESQDSVTSESATETTTAPVLPEKNSFTIRVSNGSGVSGSAAKVTAQLVADGFNVVSTGNATSYNFSTTIVYYKSGKETEANMVKDALSNRSVSIELSSSLKSYDVLVVVGKT